jgi:hypothetical protein
LPAVAPARSRRAGWASAFQRCASTATTTLRCMRWRNGRPNGPAPISARR